MPTTPQEPPKCVDCGHDAENHDRNGCADCVAARNHARSLCSLTEEDVRRLYGRVPMPPRPGCFTCGHKAENHTRYGCDDCFATFRLAATSPGRAQAAAATLCTLTKEMVLHIDRQRAAVVDGPDGAERTSKKILVVDMKCRCGHYKASHSELGCADCSCVCTSKEVVAQYTPVEIYEHLGGEKLEKKLILAAAMALDAVRGGYQNIENKKLVERTLGRVVEVGKRMTFYDRQGKEIDIFEWSDKSDDREYRIVGLTQCGSLMVSTFWLGISRGLFGKGDLGIKGIFESGVADTSDPSYSKYFKWDSETAAVEGHEKLVNAAEMKSKVKRVEITE